MEERALSSSFAVAFRQLGHQPAKLLAASAGVVVAVMLMLVQLGIREGAVKNSVAFSYRLSSDLVVLSPSSETIFRGSAHWGWGPMCSAGAVSVRSGRCSGLRLPAAMASAR